NAHIDGFIINKGYKYADGADHLMRSYRFHQSCGSAYIFAPRSSDMPQEHSDYSDSSYRDFWMIQNHNKHPDSDFRRLGYRWKCVPYFAAIYRMQVASETGARNLGERRPGLGGYLSDSTFAKVVRRKRIDAKLREEFWGPVSVPPGAV